MRWNIDEIGKSIYTTNFDGHSEDIEISGEKVSGIIGYKVSNGILHISRELIYPMFRLQPNNTLASYKVFDNDILFNFEEHFDKVVLDGVLSLFTHTNELNIIHKLYPSTTLPIFYEEVTLSNITSKIINLDFLKYKKLDGRLGCKGYLYTERFCDKVINSILPNDSIKLLFSYQARFASDMPLFEVDSLKMRKKRIDELFNQCKLTTDNPILDTMFAFAKIRAGESIFRTKNGLVHSPGGGNYYAGIWCNDQSEYSTPWFAFTNDRSEQEAAKNAISWYEKYMNDDYYPIPSSIISEGVDYWNGVGDRGDASMFLYGNTRYFLTTGIIPNSVEAKMLKWCSEYIIRKINSQGIVESNTDELENRISSGDANLNTNSLSYGAFKLYSILLERMNLSDFALYFSGQADELKKNMIKYFSANIKGYETYAYHKNLDVIRAWNCLPLYMGINHNIEGTINSIEDYLWVSGSLRSTEGEKILWDRSTLYYISTLFRCGYVDLAYTKLFEYSKNRLLGERVPYAVEAFPEFNMRHLSAESALYCRIITDGILDVKFEKDGFSIDPKMGSLKLFKLENFYCNKKYYTIIIENGIVNIISENEIITAELGKRIKMN